jgi:hypothetical protein
MNDSIKENEKMDEKQNNSKETIEITKARSRVTANTPAKTP